MKDFLILDCAGAAEIFLTEGVSKNRGTVFQGKFQEVNRPNKNNRIYPEGVLKHNVERFQETMKNRGFFGELDHAEDSVIHLENASHIITKLWWEGSTLMGEGECCPTPAGQILSNLLMGGYQVGISSRGVGSGQTNNEGTLVIGESYKLITFDVVADPSTFDAFQKVGNSKKDENYQILNNEVKNNNRSSVNKLNANLLIAFFESQLEDKRSKIINERF